MKFSAHEHDYDEDYGYDSLWSDSEEEEFPVNPSDSESEEAETPPPEKNEHEEGESPNDKGSENSRDSELDEKSFKRRSLLAELASSPRRSRPRGSPSTTRKRRSLQPGILTQDQLNNDIDQLSDMVDQWSSSYIMQYKKQNDSEHEYITKQQDQLANLEQEEMTQMFNNVLTLTERRRSNINSMVEQRRKLQELIEREKREEEERIKREEEEKRRKEEEVRRKREEEIRKQEEERKREEERLKRELEEEKEKQRKKKQEEEEQQQQKANRERELEERQRQEKKETEEKTKQEQEQQKKAESTGGGFTNWSEVDKEFAYYKQKIADIKTNILAPISEDKQLKNFCFLAKRKIRPKLGQLTTSMQQVKTILSELEDIFRDASQKHNLVYLWMLNFFAKAIVQQAETEATVSPNAATPLGIVSIQLMEMFPELVDLLIARFVKKCPQIIGYTCSIDTEEGRLRMGWKRRDGKWEEEHQYAERIGGMTSVWAVITQMKFSASSGKKHPYPIKHVWVYLARHLNRPVEQLTNSEFSSVASWWDVSAHRFLDAFGKQGHKLLQLVCEEWTDSVADKRFPAAARLRLLGEDWQKTGIATKGLAPVK